MCNFSLNARSLNRLFISAWVKLFLSQGNSVFKSFSWWFFQGIFLSKSLTVNTPWSFLMHHCSSITCWLVFIILLAILATLSFWSSLPKSNKSTLFCFYSEVPPQLFYKKCDLRNFANITGKQLCRWLFFDKVGSLRPATLLKKDTHTSVFLWIFWKFSGTRIFRDICERLILYTWPNKHLF